MLDVSFLEKCIKTLESAFELYSSSVQGEIISELYRSATVKEFEIILELSGKLLKKKLAGYYANNKSVDVLIFKEVFRRAVNHGLISVEEGERWMDYRDLRNATAHDYGSLFAEDILQAVPDFIEDSKNLLNTLKS
jgi:nucleotidyltransferase substrate binding protein (TIGR01987 family)